MEKEEIIKQAVAIIKKHLSNDCKIYLFGSWAKGNALKTSDIDLGILNNEKTPWKTMTKIKDEIEDINTLRSIDVVDLNSVDEDF